MKSYACKIWCRNAGAIGISEIRAVLVAAHDNKEARTKAIERANFLGYETRGVESVEEQL